MAAEIIVGVNAADEGVVVTAEPNAPSESRSNEPMSRGLLWLCGLFNALVFLAPISWLFFQLYRGEALGGIGPGSSDPDGIDAALKSLPCMAAVGASTGALHSLASLAVRAGRKNLHTSWAAYYVIRPFTGAGVAVVTSLVLLSGIGGFNVTSLPAQLGWAALAGLYSEQALTKLRDVFSTLLQPGGDTTDPRGGVPPKFARAAAPAPRELSGEASRANGGEATAAP